MENGKGFSVKYRVVVVDSFLIGQINVRGVICETDFVGVIGFHFGAIHEERCVQIKRGYKRLKFTNYVRISADSESGVKVNSGF